MVVVFLVLVVVLVVIEDDEWNVDEVLFFVKECIVLEWDVINFVDVNGIICVLGVINGV